MDCTVLIPSTDCKCYRSRTRSYEEEKKHRPGSWAKLSSRGMKHQDTEKRKQVGKPPLEPAKLLDTSS
jgi:hypothetical protein